MPILFNDISGLKEFIGGAVSNSMDIASIEPTIHMVAEQHLLPWIGTGLWNDLLTAFAGTPDADQATLLPYVQRPLAWLTMYEYSKIGAIQFGESGILRMVNENAKSAYKYQENLYRDFTRDQGFEALEHLLRFLDANRATYIIWDNSEESNRVRELFLNHAYEFRQNYTKRLTRYTFEILRPLIPELEIFAILPRIGQALFDALKAEILTGTITGTRKAAVGIIRKILTHFTVEEGLRRMWVRYDGDKIVQAEILEPQGAEKAGVASTQSVSLKIRHHDEFGNRHLDYLKKFLLENIEDFPEYQAWLDEQATATDLEELQEECERFKTITSCACESTCSCQASINQAVIRL